MLTLSGAGQPQNGVGIEERFVISVKTDNAGTSLDNQYTIPMVNSVPYDIKTSDGQTINNVINNYTITFPTPGTYEVKLSPSSIDGSISLDNNYAADKYKLINVLNWGVNNIANLNGLFSGSGIIAISAIDIPVLNNPNGGVNLHQVFGNTSSLLDVPNLELWDTSDVSSFRSSFYNSKLFSNENENTLDLSNWDTSNVNDFSYMFYMGNGKGKVDFNMGAWDIENMTQAISFYAGFNAQPISIENYNSTLISWAAQNATSNISISFGSSQYTYEAASARQTLIDTYGWTITDGGQVASPEFVISVKTDNAGTSADNEFTIPTNGSGYNYDIEYDGQTLTGQTGSVTLTFPSGAGTYDIKISGSFPQCYFNNGGDKAKLLDIKNFGIYALGSTSQQSAFSGCSNMNISATDIGHFENVTNFTASWFLCTSLTSFPLIDTSSGTSFSTTWQYTDILSFPLLDTSSGTNFFRTWRNSNITLFPPNAFDNNIASNYNGSFGATKLTTQSIDDILVSLDTSGVSNGTFQQSGGQAPSATGIAAKDSLVAKGWTITYTA